MNKKVLLLSLFPVLSQAGYVNIIQGNNVSYIQDEIKIIKEEVTETNWVNTGNLYDCLNDIEEGRYLSFFYKTAKYKLQTRSIKDNNKRNNFFKWNLVTKEETIENPNINRINNAKYHRNSFREFLS